MVGFEFGASLIVGVPTFGVPTKSRATFMARENCFDAGRIVDLLIDLGLNPCTEDPSRGCVLRFWNRKATSSVLLAGAAGIPMMAEFVDRRPSVAIAAGSIGLLATLAGNHFLGEEQDSRLALTKRSFFLEEACRGAYQAVQSADTSVRLNVMLLEWPIWPVTRLFDGRFNFHTKLGMEAKPDEHLRLYGSQGVAGKAIKDSCWAVGDIAGGKLMLGSYGIVKPVHTQEPVEYGLDAKQLAATSALKLIYSFPFHRLKQGKEDPDTVRTSDVLGVVNVDSQMNMTHYVETKMQLPGGKQLTLHELLLSELLPSLARVSSLLFS